MVNIQKLKDWFTPSKQRIILLIAVFVMAIFLFKDCGRTNNDDQITQMEQNIAAYKDSLHKERNKVGEWQYKHAVLASTNKTLEEQNSELAAEVEKQKGKVIYLSKINVQLNQTIDSLMNTPDNPGSITVNPNDDGSQDVNWKYAKDYGDGNSRYMEGTAKIVFRNDTSITKTYISPNGDTIKLKIPLIDEDSVLVSIPIDKMNVKLVTGLERDKKDDVLRIFVRSEYPGFNVTNIEGAIIDPQKDELIKSYFPNKRWVIGPVIGGGFDGDLKPTIFVGAGITFKLISF